jgi:hypothetical protein
MNKMDLILNLAGLLTLGLSTTTQATLIDRGNGMIYDTDQDLTWLQDANYAYTSGYNDVDGLMTWHEATAWADGLVFGGYDDWRLPALVIQDENFSDSGTDNGYNVNTSNSELAYMFHVNLGNESRRKPDGTLNTESCLADWENPGCLQHTSADGVDILNLQFRPYWLGKEYDAPYDYLSWLFSPNDGSQNPNHNDDYFHAWAVRSGDVVASVPEPGTLMLMLAGLAGIGATRWRQS